MVTHHAAGVLRLIDRLNLAADTAATLLNAFAVPSSVRAALDDPYWRRATEEYAALLDNHTWNLVPRPPDTNVVTGKWLFRHKLTSDGSLDRYKTCWVLRGFTQHPGLDYNETFSHVIKFAVVRVVLSLTLSGLGDPSTRCQECLPPRHSDGDCLLQPAHRLPRRRSSRPSLSTEPLHVRPQAGAAGMVRAGQKTRNPKPETRTRNTQTRNTRNPKFVQEFQVATCKTRIYFG
jgi:hypothetical protein